MAVTARAELLVEATRQLTWRQALNRPRRAVPARLLAGSRPEGRRPFVPLAAGLGVEQAPQSGPLPPPHCDRAFRAVGRERSADDPELWTASRDGALFLFHLHGFSDLARYTAGARSAPGDEFWAGQIADWLAKCGEPGAFPLAWHPYPLSGRVLSWCAALSASGWPAHVADAMLASLAWQLKLLRRSVEDDIGGNHVLRNATALVVGGRCCGDTKALRRGRAVLRRELPRQVLADGVHEERSPSYSREVLGDLEHVAEVERRAGAAPDPALGAATRRMRRALGALAGPDGTLPRFNDAWDGPPLARREGASFDLSEAGYVVLREGGDQVVLDVGPLCPPHLPPHAHADALSFVLWADGRPLVVDPGSRSYEPEDRAWSRGTLAHSTLELDGADQCVFWGAFRASKLPNVRRGALEEVAGCRVLTASHDGYGRLADPAEHVRTFCWLPGDGLVVVDRIRSRGAHDARLSLPLAPGARSPLRIATLDGAEPGERPGWVAPYFGARQESRVLEQRARLEPGRAVGWLLTRSDAEVSVAGEQVEVRRAGRDAVRFRAPL